MKWELIKSFTWIEIKISKGFTHNLGLIDSKFIQFNNILEFKASIDF